MNKDIYETPQVQILEMEVGGPVMDGTVGTLGGNDDYGSGGDPFNK